MVIYSGYLSGGTMHLSVMLRETLEALAVVPGGSYIDGTLGGAGHAYEIL